MRDGQPVVITTASRGCECAGELRSAGTAHDGRREEAREEAIENHSLHDADDGDLSA